MENNISFLDILENLHAEILARLQNVEEAMEALETEDRFTITDLGLKALGLDETEIELYHAGEVVL